MAKLDLENIKRNLSKKQNEELLEILSEHLEDYQPEAINIIKEILLDRGVDIIAVNSKMDLFQEKKLKSTNLNNKSKGSFQKWIIRALIIISLYVVARLLLNYFLLSNITVQNKNFWNTSFVSQFKKSLKDFYSNYFDDDYSKEACSICTIEKFESTFPNGFKDIPNDSLRKLIIKNSTACVKSYKIKNVMWPKNYKDSLYNIFINQEIFKNPNLDNSKKRRFCTYYIEQLEKCYPLGLYELIPVNLQDSISKSYFKK